MKIYPMTRPIQRYIALDIHKAYVLAGGMNAKQEWTLPPRRIEISKFGELAQRNLCESDAVVIETTTNVWDTDDMVQPLGVMRLWRIQPGCVRSPKHASRRTRKMSND